MLVMDDNPSVLTSMQYMLETCGCRATLVADGEACVEAYRGARNGLGRYGLVILDLVIAGGRDGLWTLRQLQKIDPEVRAVLATSNEVGRCNTVTDHRALGFQGCLQKPFGVHELLAALRQALRARTRLSMRSRQ